MFHPIPVSERISILYVDRGQIEQEGHTVVCRSIDMTTVLPVGKTAVIMIGPGVSISHARQAVLFSNASFVRSKVGVVCRLFIEEVDRADMGAHN